MAIIQKPKEESIVIYQIVPEGVGEPALIVEKYTDVITITQEDRYININTETLKELFKVLKGEKLPF